ncbi:MAG: pirin family protein [Sandaracinaceae bacterium]
MTDLVLGRFALGFPWRTLDPFLFCVHHEDAYPQGNDRLGPAASLEGRDLGMDFAGKDGWRMYHGEVVPGFPQHPHRGFETVTVARRGVIDHSDSLGAAARFGHGDVQWMTAGRGIVHAEMFPLLRADAPNDLELFQIWLNLPPEDKLVDPHFALLWNERIPTHTFTDPDGGRVEVTTYAGALEGALPPSPPPRSWAARSDTDVAIWSLRLGPSASWTLPPARGAETMRTLYFFIGPSLRLESEVLTEHAGVVVRSDRPVRLSAGPEGAELLLLQGRPIGAPVAQYGPFVMNSRVEIQQAFEDYRATRFGGWPWPSDDPVHPREAGRFARHVDGRRETP